MGHAFPTVPTLQLLPDWAWDHHYNLPQYCLSKPQCRPPMQPVLRLGGLKLSRRSAPGPMGLGIYLILLEFISHRNEQSKCCWQFDVLKGVHILSATPPPKVSLTTPFSPTFHHCGWAPVSVQCLPYLPVTRFSSSCTLGFPSSSLWNITQPHRDLFCHWHTVCHHPSLQVEIATMSFRSLIQIYSSIIPIFQLSISLYHHQWPCSGMSSRRYSQKPVHSLYLLHKWNSLISWLSLQPSSSGVGW